MFCRFGNVPVKAEFISAVMMKCIAPELPQPSENGQEEHAFAYSVDKQNYYDVPHIKWGNGEVWSRVGNFKVTFRFIKTRFDKLIHIFR